MGVRAEFVMGGAGAPGWQAADLATPISLRRENVRRERVGLFGRRRRPSVPRPEPGAKPPARVDESARYYARHPAE